MGRNYVSARAVLSEELLQRVCEAVGGRQAFMWVPAVRNLHKMERDRQALDMRARGFPAATIADRLFVSERTVWRILARAREENATADDSGAARP